MGKIGSEILVLLGKAILTTVGIALLLGLIGSMPTPRWMAPFYLLPLAYLACRLFPKHLRSWNVLPLILAICLTFPLIDKVIKVRENYGDTEWAVALSISVFVLQSLLQRYSSRLEQMFAGDREVVRRHKAS